MNRNAQKQRILRALKEAHGRWVSLPIIQRPFNGPGIASHTRRISDLRADGWDIENKKELVEGQWQSSYRLIPHNYYKLLKC